MRIPVDGGPPELVAEPDSGSNHLFFAPELLPNGKGVIVSIAPGSPTPAEYDVAVLNVATGEYDIVVRGVFARYPETGHLVFVRVDGSVLAAPFDQDHLELTGPPVPLFGGVRLKDRGTVDFALSASGSLVYGAGADVGEALYGTATPVWVDRDGTITPVDPDWTFNAPRTLSIALSPDGQRLALDILDGTADIWVKQLDRGPLTRLTFEGTENTGVAWLPDGQSVSFSSNSGGVMQTVSRRADGTGATEPLVDLEPSPVWDGQWSPDGEWYVVRVKGTDANPDLWAFRPGVDSLPTPLLESAHALLMPRISPNGRWLLYTSDESGEQEVYVRPFPNVDDGRWQISTDGGTEAMWAHSGEELFFINGAGELVAVQVETEIGFEMGEHQVLFQTEGWRRASAARHYYDITPDDQRFIMIRDLGSAVTTDVIIVENFFEELKAKVGN